MIISIASTKGGVGKSVTALQIATYLLTQEGKKVFLIDADAQRTSYLSTYIRGQRIDAFPKLPSEVILGGEEVYKAALEKNKEYDYVVIDVGGRDTGALRGAILASDKVIIPMRANSADIWAVTNDLIPIIEEARKQGGKFDAYLFLSQMHARPTKNEREAVNYLSANGFEGLIYIDARLTDRVAFADGQSIGSSVCELKPKDVKACVEVKLLVKETVFAKAKAKPKAKTKAK